MPDSCVERIGRGARADESRRHGSLRNGAQLGTAKTGTDAEAVLARTNGLLWSRVALAAAALVPAGVLAQSTTQIDDHVVVLGRWDNPFGYNVIGLPRRRRRRRARGSAPASDRRDSRGSAGLDRHATQRHGQVEPDVPARLQPRPRHRLRDVGRRHASEPADARARPGVHRLELLDPGARRAARVPQGRVLRRDGGFLVRGRRALVDVSSSSRRECSKPASARTAISARSRPTASRQGRDELLYGVQAHRYDGPWVDIDEDVERNNLLVALLEPHRRRRLERRADGL